MLQAQPQDVQGQLRVEIGLEVTLGRAQGGELVKNGGRRRRGRLPAQVCYQVLVGQQGRGGLITAEQ